VRSLSCDNLIRYLTLGRTLKIYLPFILLFSSSCFQGQEQTSESIQLTKAYAITGIDTRTRIADADAKIQEVSLSVAAIISKDQITDLDESLLVRPLRFESQFCAGEQFSHEPRYTGCSAFKIADHLVATAAHCINPSRIEQFCEDNDIVFGFNNAHVQLDGDRNAITDIKQRAQCKSVRFYSYDDRKEDVAIIEIAPRSDIRNLELSLTRPNIGDDVFMIGHGSGYLANSHTGVVLDFNFSKNEFDTSNDSFGGDSGSPVIDFITGEVVGIHSSVRFGHMIDRILDTKNSCFLTPRFSGQALPFGAGNYHKFVDTTLSSALDLLLAHEMMLEDGQQVYLSEESKDLIRLETQAPRVTAESELDFELEQLTEFEQLVLAFWSFESRKFDLFVDLVEVNPRLGHYGWDPRPNFRTWRPRKLVDLITGRFSLRREHLNRGFYARMNHEQKVQMKELLERLTQSEMLQTDEFEAIRLELQDQVIPSL
jgi:hypothetical protein